MLKPERLEELKTILKEEFDMDLPQEQVEQLGESLLTYYGFMQNHYSNVHETKHEKHTATGR